jgi:hypothetical protein
LVSRTDLNNATMKRFTYNREGFSQRIDPLVEM